MEREFNTAEVTAAVKIHLAACLMDDVARELGRVLTRQQRRGVLRRAEGLHTLYISIHSPHTGRDRKRTQLFEEKNGASVQHCLFSPAKGFFLLTKELFREKKRTFFGANRMGAYASHRGNEYPKGRGRVPLPVRNGKGEVKWSQSKSR